MTDTTETEEVSLPSLPKLWIWARLECLSEHIVDCLHSTPQFVIDNGMYCIDTTCIQPGKIIFERARLVSNDTYQERIRRLEPQVNDILFAREGTIGTTVIVPENIKLCLGQRMMMFRPHNIILPSYFMWAMQSSLFVSQWKPKVIGTTAPHVNIRDLKIMFLPLAPLNEQHRIVEAIETQFTRLDAAVTALKRSQANLKRYRAAVLKAACEGRLVPTEVELAQAEGRSYEPASVLLERILAERRRKWEAENPKRKYQEPVAPDTSALPELPEGWCWASMDQLVSKIEAGKSPKAENRPAKPDELGVLKVSAVSWGEFQPEENKTLFHASLSVENLSVKAGDVLISRANTVELVGAVVLVRQDYPNLLLSDKTLRLVFVSDELLRFYVIQALRTPWVRRIYEELATGTSDSMRNLSQEKILSAPIPLPPFVEQQRIVAELERRFSLITQLEKTIEADLARANRLRQSILKRAFAGQLVPQDPNDEPAAVLLERIQAAKQGQPVQKEFPLSL